MRVSRVTLVGRPKEAVKATKHGPHSLKYCGGLLAATGACCWWPQVLLPCCYHGARVPANIPLLQPVSLRSYAAAAASARATVGFDHGFSHTLGSLLRKAPETAIVICVAHTREYSSSSRASANDQTWGLPAASSGTKWPILMLPLLPENAV